MKGFGKILIAIALISSLVFCACGGKVTVFDGDYKWAALSETEGFSSRLNQEKSKTVAVERGIEFSSSLTADTVFSFGKNKTLKKLSFKSEKSGNSYKVSGEIAESASVAESVSGYSGKFYFTDGEFYCDLLKNDNGIKTAVSGLYASDFSAVLARFAGEETVYYQDLVNILSECDVLRSAASMDKAEDCTRVKIVTKEAETPSEDGVNTSFTAKFVYDRDYYLIAFKIELNKEITTESGVTTLTLTAEAYPCGGEVTLPSFDKYSEIDPL